MMKKKHRTIPGKRALRRYKTEVKRLRRQIDRLTSQPCQIVEPVDDAGLVRPPTAAMIFGSEIEAIRNYVLQYPNLETGGSLYGWYSESGLPIIALVTGPGRNAMHHEVRFHADEAYSFAMGNAIVEYGLQHVGEWHSHHKINLNRPSGVDCDAMRTSLASPNSPVGRFLCGIANIVGSEVTFNAYYFSRGNGDAYSHTPLVVKNGCSPLRTGLKGRIEAIERKGGLS